MPEVPQTMVDDLPSLSRQALCLENRFNLKKRVVLISTAEIEQLFRTKDKMGWNRFRQRFPASSGITTLSRVVFDAPAFTHWYTSGVKGIGCQGRAPFFSLVLPKANGR